MKEIVSGYKRGGPAIGCIPILSLLAIILFAVLTISVLCDCEDSEGADSSSRQYLVTYLNEDGTVLNREKVQSGESAKYDEVPSKLSADGVIYTFKGWSTDGETVEDLSVITSNKTVRPLFDSELVDVTVIFYDHDGTLIAEKTVKYGAALTDVPDDPVKEDSVDKVFTFVGWYVKSSFLNTVPDPSLKADLSCVKSTTLVYAAYTYVSHPYTLTIRFSDGESVDVAVTYGEFLNESVMISTVEDYTLKFYRDSDMTQAVGITYQFTGDTVLYAEKLPGAYTYTGTDEKTISVSMGAGKVSLLKKTDGAYVVCDISQFTEGKSVFLSSELLSVLKDGLGADADIRLVLARGEYTVNLGVLLDASDSEGLVFSADKGPTSSVRINSALKNVHWDKTYTLIVKHGGKMLSAGEMGITVSVSYEADSDDSVTPMVWSANSNTGLLTPLEHILSNGKLSFMLTDAVYYVSGTSAERTGESKTQYTCPYGEVEYNCGGETELTYNSTLLRMTINNGGDILYVPSALEGYPLKHIGSQAFSGVINAPALVIPSTVETFDWSSLYGSSISAVYFLGDKPDFTGDAPTSVTVYHSDKATGWENYPSMILTMLNYTKSSFSFRYYLVGEEITVAEWVKGKDVIIPSYISVNGAEYPVRTIGCNAFAGSDIEYVSIPDSVIQIQTRAFYKCQNLEKLSWGSSPSIGIMADECFRGCINLRSSSATIPEGVCFIGFEAFRDCQMFRTIVIPNTVTDIRGGAFYDCVLLAEVTLSNRITLIPERCFGYCNSLDGVILPDSVTEVADNAFYSCDMLTSINLNKTQTVGIYAFNDCGTLGSVTFGSELKALSRDSFKSCTMLSYVYAYCEQPEGLEDCGLTENVILYVNYNVESQWTADHLVIEKEDDLKQSFEAATMPYVIAGLIILFIVLAIYSWRYRVKNMM